MPKETNRTTSHICDECLFCVLMSQEDGIPAMECLNSKAVDRYRSWVSGDSVCEQFMQRQKSMPIDFGGNCHLTRNQIELGLKYGLIQLIIDPNLENGTVCSIGDDWFYFGGLTAEALSPEEYRKAIPITDISDEILNALEGFKKNGCESEYLYCAYFLQENIMAHKQESIRKAEQVLIDNGIEPDEAPVVLQALGYVLLDEELYPGKE